jgi:hypothetical protein
MLHLADKVRARQPLQTASRPQFRNGGFQRRLAHWNRERLSPGLPAADWQIQVENDAAMMWLEGEFLEELRAEAAAEAALAPADPEHFIAWFEALMVTGPGQGDPLFPWLANEATRDELRWFLQQEAAGEAGFEDLTALTQIKLPIRPKLELARNYWDEMGRGQEKGMHGPMLASLIETLALEPQIETTVWESLALANAMIAMATSRRYAWQSVGALGAIELTAPGRSACVAEGLKRIGLTSKERSYFVLHAVLDLKHSADWNREVIAPAVAEDPRRASAIAEGALIRLACGARCFERYRSHFARAKSYRP